MNQFFMPDALTSEMNNVSFIAKSGKWLDILNKHLVATQGKGNPRDVINGDLLTKNKNFERLNRDVKARYPEPLSLDVYNSDMPFSWLWYVNKVVYRISRELIDAIAVPDDKVIALPIDPLLNTPQWVTCVALSWDKGGVKDADGHIQRALMYGLTKIGGKDYMMIVLYMETETGLIQMNIYIDVSAPTIGEGFEWALRDLPNIKPSEFGRTMRITEMSAMICDIINMILFINGEYHKSLVGKSTRVWEQPRKAHGGGFRIKPRLATVFATVGQEMVATVDAAKRARTEGGERRAHIRRGHWHHYWTGPRGSKQTYVLHWLPPIIVSGTELADDD